MSSLRERVLFHLKEMEYPTIDNLAKELHTNRQYVSVLLNSMKEEKIVVYTKVGNSKIWRMKK